MRRRRAWVGTGGAQAGTPAAVAWLYLRTPSARLIRLPSPAPCQPLVLPPPACPGVGIAERGVLAAPGRLGKHSSEPEALGLLERSPSPRHSSKARRDAGDASVAALEEGLAHGSGNGGLLHGGAAGSNGGLLRGGSGGSNGGLYDPHPSLLPLHGLADGGLLEQGGSLGGSPGGSLRGGGAPAEAMGRRPSIDGFTAGAGLVGRRRPGQQDSSESLSFELGPPEASEGPLLGGAVGAPGAAGAAGGRHVSFLTAMLMGVALCFHSLLEGAAMGAQPTIRCGVLRGGCGGGERRRQQPWGRSAVPCMPAACGPPRPPSFPTSSATPLPGATASPQLTSTSPARMVFSPPPPPRSNSLHIFIAIVSHKGLAAYALGSSIVDSDARWVRAPPEVLPCGCMKAWKVGYGASCSWVSVSAGGQRADPCRQGAAALQPRHMGTGQHLRAALLLRQTLPPPRFTTRCRRSMRRFWSVILPFTFASPIGIFLGYIVSDLAKGVGAASISALASGDCRTAVVLKSRSCSLKHHLLWSACGGEGS